MSDKDLVTKGFKSLAYAPPSVVSEELNQYLKLFLFSAVFGNDLVPRLSFGAVRDLCEMVLFFHKKEKGLKACEITSSFLYGRKIDELEMIQAYNEIKTVFKCSVTN